MKTLHKQAVKYSAELIAVHYNQEDFDKIAVLWQGLMEADRAQKNFKKERSVLTNKLNTAWDYVLQINRASKLVFADNLAKLEQYNLSDERTTPEPEPETEEGGEV